MFLESVFILRKKGDILPCFLVHSHSCKICDIQIVSLPLQPYLKSTYNPFTSKDERYDWLFFFSSLKKHTHMRTNELRVKQEKTERKMKRNDKILDPIIHVATLYK